MDRGITHGACRYAIGFVGVWMQAGGCQERASCTIGALKESMPVPVVRARENAKIAHFA